MKTQIKATISEISTEYITAKITYIIVLFEYEES